MVELSFFLVIFLMFCFSPTLFSLNIRVCSPPLRGVLLKMGKGKWKSVLSVVKRDGGIIENRVATGFGGRRAIVHSRWCAAR